ERHRDDLVQVGLADDRGDGAGLEAGHVEQVADEVVEAVGAVLNGLQQFHLVLFGPLDVIGAQGGDRRLDTGERGAQVVTDGSEEDRKSTRLNSSHVKNPYAGFRVKKKNQTHTGHSR